MSVGDTVFSPPTTAAMWTLQFISLPTFHLEVRRILVFLIKLPSFLKQIFHIYYFLEEKHFYKKNLVVQDFRKKEFDSFHEKNPNHIGWDYGQELCQIQDFHSRGSGRTTYRNFFKNKEESSCPHSYYAKTDKKRIFVNYPLILFDILIPSLIRRRIAVFSVLLTLPFLR